MNYIYKITVVDTNNNKIEIVNVSTKNFIEAVERGNKWCKNYMKDLNKLSDDVINIDKKYKVFVDSVENMGNII
jgi:hypothetical protein